MDSKFRMVSRTLHAPPISLQSVAAYRGLDEAIDGKSEADVEE